MVTQSTFGTDFAQIGTMSKFYISQEGSDLEISAAQEELGLKKSNKTLKNKIK